MSGVFPVGEIFRRFSISRRFIMEITKYSVFFRKCSHQVLGAAGARTAGPSRVALASCCFGLVVSPIYQMMIVAVCALRPEALPCVARLRESLSFRPGTPI